MLGGFVGYDRTPISSGKIEFGDLHFSYLSLRMLGDGGRPDIERGVAELALLTGDATM